MSNKVAVIAIGGNSLIKDKAHQSVQDQYDAADETSKHIAKMIKQGWNVAIAHGNGPQVGFILRRSELAAHELHEVPLDVCGADSQGAIGYALQQTLYNHFQEMGIDKEVATVVTQVEVGADDPAFKNPTKPIGSFMDEAQAMSRRENDGWDVVEDAGRGWRRVVASPLPKRIVEETASSTPVSVSLRLAAVASPLWLKMASSKAWPQSLTKILPPLCWPTKLTPNCLSSVRPLKKSPSILVKKTSSGLMK